MTPGLNDDLTRSVAESAAGGALRIQDLSGVGQKTQRNLRAAGYRSIQDIKDASPEELSNVSGIGTSTAKKMIREAGGNPNRQKRSSSGSVSAAGIHVPVGEFRVDFADKDKAEAKMSSSLNKGFGRTKQAAQSDKGKRAPVTTDYDQWKNNKGQLDFPGVDTPTEDPQVRPEDRQHISAEDTTLEQREGSLFVRENNTTGGTSTSLKGLFSGGRGASASTRQAAADVAREDVGADVDEPSGGDAVADVTFLEREEEGFGEELIPFGAEESDRNSFEF